MTISAPLENQSGTNGNTTDPLPSATLEETLTGHRPVYAVDGFPADSVLYALQELHANPDLLVSGINDGQNISLPIIAISGTVGAARVGGRDDIPAVAVSQGLGGAPTFTKSAEALMAWVHDFLLGREGPARFQSVVNINVPVCRSGSIRGTVEVPPAASFSGSAANCESTLINPAYDVAGFVNGFVTVSSIGT